MASSSDRDKDSSTAPPKPENPFIRFRQFADAQIGSFLQGVIGLPSAFSRKPAGGTQWDAFDEELRRRDELQARQKELRDSLAKSKAPQEGEEVEVPVKKSADWKSASAWDEQATSAGHDLDIDGTRDVPLYSPVTKWLFAHLQRPDDPNVDWQRKDQASSGTGTELHNFMLKLRPDQISSDVMRMTQYAIYNELNSSPTFRSDYSLLPYLMFSAYSPLRLSAYSQLGNTKGDQFPYLEAFEDLLRCQQQTPPPPTFFGLPLSHFRPHAFLGRAGVLGIVPSNISWVTSLYSSGLLQEQEERAATHIFQLPPFARVTKMGSETEQDMYEQFLRWAAPNTTTKAGQSFVESIFQQMDEEGDTFPNRGLRIAEEIRKALNDRNERTSEELTDFSKELKDLWESYSDLEKDFGKETNEKESTQGHDPNRVTSSSTTTTRTVNDDGSVETSVTVRKVFADGRSTTTTTEHFEEPAERDWEDDNWAPQKSAEDKERGQEKMEAKKPNGWFWN